MIPKWRKKAIAGVLSTAMVLSAAPATSLVALADEENQATELAREAEADKKEDAELPEKSEEETIDAKEASKEDLNDKEELKKEDLKEESKESEGDEESEDLFEEGALDSEVLDEDALLDKSEKDEEEEKESNEVKELLHFSMDNTEEGLKSGSYTAAVSGGNIAVDKDAKYLKSLSFGGGSYLTVKDEDGKSPLDGLDEFTINYYSKGSNSGAGWTVFAVRDNETPSHLKSEHYVGIMDKSTSVKVERYKVDNANRPATNNARTNAGWKMVTVVVRKDSTTLFVDGKKIDTVESDNLVTDILQDNSTFYIGKANWAGGEYFYGNIDEFAIYSGAMSDEEVSSKYVSDDEELIVDDKDKLKLAAEEIKLAVTDNIKGNITLPTKNSYGAEVKWESSNPELISDKAVKVSDYDDIPAGVVKRTDKKEEVTLKATISLADEEIVKEFKVTIAPKAEKKKLENYLFAFFPSNSEEQLYFAAGKDHLHFTDLNDGEPVLTSEIGDKGVRDPFIMRSAEGDHFYMIATDLKVETTGWGTAQFGGSLRMLVWESDDLVNWSKPRLVDVGLENEDFAQKGKVGCLWAPEAIYDELTGEYVVFWASMSTDSSHQVTYYSKTRDFVNFTTAKKYIDRGNKQHCIDTSIVKGSDGQYYRVSADTNANGGSVSELILETSDKVLGDWTRLANMAEIQKGMKNYDSYEKDTRVEFAGGVVEGPELFALNDGKNFGLYMDNYGGRGYIPTTTTDISDLTGKSWTLYTSDQYDFGSLKKRHGSILGITAEEYAAVMSKWGKSTTEVGEDEQEEKEPVLVYDFENVDGETIKDESKHDRDGKLNGNAKIVKDENRGNVLSLDGNKSFASFPKGFFDGRDKCTISFDMRSDNLGGNFFNFTFGKDNVKYYYLRARETSTYMGITRSSWSAESGVNASTSSIREQWNNYTVVFDKDKMYLYINSELKGENKIATKVSDLGKNLEGYLGKSFYSGDDYVRGFYDNVKVYNRVLTEKEIADLNGVVLEPLKKVTSKDVTFITQTLDKENKELTCYISKNNTKGQPTSASLDFELLTGAKLTDKESTYDLTKDGKVTVEIDGKEVVYTLKFVLSNNPLLGGQFADPDIDCFNGKFYIYPTTDGVSGWGGYQFHAFSSDNLVDWKDEGVIVDLKQDASEKVLNENGVEIAAVPWSDGNAWAPSIEEKNGKYYFYFCGNDTETNAKAIGVAYADNPAGPFKVLDKPLISINTCKRAGIEMGQAIDPSVFTDVDGTSYLSFGNGKAAIVKLNDDMISIDESTMENVGGLNGFRESLIITYRDGKYHYTWSCDDTGSENYSVAYGTSDKLGGRVDYRGMLLQKEPEQAILGTGHHSILNVPGTDDWYVAYHRFMTPLGQVSEGFGYHREVCLDKLTFDEDGYMVKVTPTNEGITEPVHVKTSEPTPTPAPSTTPSGSGSGASSGSSSGSSQSSGQSSRTSASTTPAATTAPALTQEELTTIADALTPLGVSRTNAKATTSKKVAANNNTNDDEQTVDEETEVPEEEPVATEEKAEVSSEDTTDAQADKEIVDETVPKSSIEMENKGLLSPAAVIAIIIAAAAVLAGAAISIFRFRKK